MNHLMAKFDGIKGQELLDVEEQKDEITLIFKDNRYMFIKIENGKLVSDSVPEQIDNEAAPYYQEQFRKRNTDR